MKQLHYISTGSLCTPSTGFVYGSIQVINDATFAKLTPQTGYVVTETKGTTAMASGSNACTFYAGTIIYGRWVEIQVSSGIVIAYLEN